jgi:hypothetical protein
LHGIGVYLNCPTLNFYDMPCNKPKTKPKGGKKKNCNCGGKGGRRG